MTPPPPILLVEDNQDDADLTLRAFNKQGFVNPVVVAKNGVEALAYLHGKEGQLESELGPLPILTLLDINLPKIHGLEVLKQIRQHPRTNLLNVVILTSSKQDEDISCGYQGGANSYIRKPVDFNQFVNVIGQLGLYWLELNESSLAQQTNKLITSNRHA